MFALHGGLRIHSDAHAHTSELHDGHPHSQPLLLGRVSEWLSGMAQVRALHPSAGGEFGSLPRHVALDVAKIDLNSGSLRIEARLGSKSRRSATRGASRLLRILQRNERLLPLAAQGEDPHIAIPCPPTPRRGIVRTTCSLRSSNIPARSISPIFCRTGTRLIATKQFVPSILGAAGQEFRYASAYRERAAW